MTTHQLRYSGFNDPLGKEIFEGDYLILDLHDLNERQIEERQLDTLVKRADIRYMQVYLKPTNELRYELKITFVNNQLEPLTSSNYYYIIDGDGMTEEEWNTEFGKDNSLTEVYTSFVLKEFDTLKNMIRDQNWFKKEPIHAMENYNG